MPLQTHDNTGADGCTTYGSLVIRAEKNQGRGCPCMLQILRYEWMQLYCSTNPDTLRMCFLPSILSSQIVSKVDDTPAQILIALLPACQCAALFCTRVSSSHFPSKYYHRRNGAPSKGQVAVLIPVNGSVLEVGSLWMLLR